MKIINWKVFLFFLFLMQFSTTCFSQNNIMFLNNLKWGMSKQDIIKLEGSNKPFQESQDLLMYNKSIDNKKYLIGYVFQNNKLLSYTVVVMGFKNNDDSKEFENKLLSDISNKYKLNNDIEAFKMTGLPSQAASLIMSMEKSENWQKKYDDDSTNVFFKNEFDKNGQVKIRYMDKDYLGTLGLK